LADAYCRKLPQFPITTLQINRGKAMPLKINHKNVISSSSAIDFMNGRMVTFLIIETNLRLNSGDVAFDQNAINELIQTVYTRASEQHYAGDVVRLVEVSK
jgi:hypothetical protein